MKSVDEIKIRKHLKENGFILDKKPHQIDKILLNSFPKPEQEKLKAIWALMHGGVSNGLGMYSIPKTSKQAAILFSYDWTRTVASNAWSASIVSELRPQSIIEMGCGAGFLLDYLSVKHTQIRMQGIDSASNLIAIASERLGQQLIVGDYLSDQPDTLYDLILCDFGFDLANFKPSTIPHSTANCGDSTFCPGCSDDVKNQMDFYMNAWRNWGNSKSHLALTGRIKDFGWLKGVFLSALECGWVLSLEQSKILRVKDLDGNLEEFPALLFRPNELAGPTPTLEEVSAFYLA